MRVKLTGGPEEFLGISLDEFCADHNKGEAYNHITVAISGAVTCAIPLSLLFKATPYFNYVGKYIGVNALRLGASSSTPMTYENTTCVALGCAGNYKPVGMFLGTIDPAYDGIRLLLQIVPKLEKVKTESNLGEDPADISASESAAAVDPPPAVDLPAATNLPACLSIHEPKTPMANQLDKNGRQNRRLRKNGCATRKKSLKLRIKPRATEKKSFELYQLYKLVQPDISTVAPSFHGRLFSDPF